MCAVPKRIGVARMKLVSMARKKKAEKELQPNIKVRLDYKTVITIKDMDKFAFWKEKYPNAEVIT